MDRFGSDFGAFDDMSEAGGYAADDSPADDGAHSNPPPSPVGQDERRMQVRAYNHWSSLLGQENLPHIEDLEPEFLGDFGPFSVLLDFSTGSGTPTLQFIGDELQKECCEYDPIETLSEIPDGSLLSKIADNYLRVVEEQGPVSFEAESTNTRGQSVAYRGILLPYSSDLDTIDFVYAVINWKEVVDAQTADALLEEIDRAMDYGLTEIEPLAETAPARSADILHFESFASAAQEAPDASEETISIEPESTPWLRDDNVLGLRDVPDADASDDYSLPSPSFGAQASDEETIQANELSEGVNLASNDPHNEEVDEPMAYDNPDATPETPKRNRLTDALGNPVGGAPVEDAADGNAGGITSAADYGLPEWDEDEDIADDVDDLVNPLANIDLNSRLLSLVNSGSRGKKTVDLATLSDTQEDDEDESAGFDRKLFRPKAPSVDTLLSPEPYEEEGEGVDAETPGTLEGLSSAEEDAAFAEKAEAQSENEIEEVAEETPAGEDLAGAAFLEADVSEQVSVHEPAAETVEEPVEDDFDEYAAVEFAEDGDVFELDEPVEAYIGEEAFLEVEAEPFELSEEVLVEADVFELAETDELAAAEDETETGYVLEDEVSHVAEPAEDRVEDLATDDVLELAEIATDEPVAEATTDEKEETTGAPAPGGLTGLLAAVQELSEAARTTDDEERRALYEAVGRAFDVSIKAVMASGKPAESVVAPLPLDDLAPTGPDMALVMVRRHANGDTEVLGEVPHDTHLMEDAQRRLASR